MDVAACGSIILGTTVDGARFRPSDWAERLAGHFARYDVDRRLHYSPLVCPVMVEAQRGLRLDPRLQHTNPAGFEFLMAFVRAHRLYLYRHAPAARAAA